MTVDEIIHAMLEWERKGYGKLPVLIRDCRTGVLEEISVHQTSDPALSDGMEDGVELEPNTPYMEIYVG